MSVKTPNRTRNVQMIIRVTQEEKDVIIKNMRRSGISHINRYARKMLINGYVINVDLSHYHELAKEVSRIGANINQITKFANANGGIYPQEITQLQERMTEIWQLLKSSLSGLQSKKL